MPHIAIKMYPGRDEETKKRLAQAILETASNELNRGKEHFSVSIEDVPQENWKEAVYDKVVADKNTLIQPGYTM
ncbi:MAG: tautomerase family protein [Treponema sp.]|nr:tautomerase family protein [Treponema sp.]